MGQEKNAKDAIQTFIDLTQNHIKHKVVRLPGSSTYRCSPVFSNRFHYILVKLVNVVELQFSAIIWVLGLRQIGERDK